MQKDTVQDRNRSITVRRATTVNRRSPEADAREVAVHMRLHFSKALLWLWRDLATHLRRDFSKTLAWLWCACLSGAGAYRPDLHYMRGPGPAWHAKYGHLASDLWPRCAVDAQKILPASSRSP
jgi:hypothetical protein